MAKKNKKKKARVNNLNIRETTIKEIEKNWGITPLLKNRLAPVFVRCNPKGEVNWEITSHYQLDDLVGRKINIVSILK